MGGTVFSLGVFTNLGHWPLLIIQVFTGVLIVVLSGELFKIGEYVSFKAIMLEKIKPNQST